LQYISGCPSNNRIKNERLRTKLGTSSRNIRNYTSQNVANERKAYDKIGGRGEVINNHTNLYLSIYGSTALCWTLAAFQILDPIHSR
jgi:hypothetical protein